MPFNLPESSLLLLTLTLLPLLLLPLLPTTPSTSSLPPHPSFPTYKSLHSLTFPSPLQDSYRHSIYLSNLARITQHNSNPHRSYDMGVNMFAHLTKDEFRQTYLGLRTGKRVDDTRDVEFVKVDVDWQAAGVVTRVKNQGRCASCYAFSATGALEGLGKIVDGVLTERSEQELVDCSLLEGNQGCGGGLMDYCFKYVKRVGSASQRAYPYIQVLGVCHDVGGKFKISSYVDIVGCSNLANSLLKGPVSVAVDASNWDFYKTGIFSDCETQLDHGVLLTGATDQYWRVKNSWSAKWGEEGYIRLARGNTCGICNVASMPFK